MSPKWQPVTTHDASNDPHIPDPSRIDYTLTEADKRVVADFSLALARMRTGEHKARMERLAAESTARRRHDDSPDDAA